MLSATRISSRLPIGTSKLAAQRVVPVAPSIFLRDTRHPAAGKGSTRVCSTSAAAAARAMAVGGAPASATWRGSTGTRPGIAARLSIAAVKAAEPTSRRAAAGPAAMSTSGARTTTRRGGSGREGHRL